MRIDEFDYNLPEKLIAQKPADRRDSSRLLVVHRDSGRLEHRRFYDILEYLRPGDCLVLNDSRVIPARIFGRKLLETGEMGAHVEFLLIRRRKDAGEIWEVMVRPGRRLKPGDRVLFGVPEEPLPGRRQEKQGTEGESQEKPDTPGEGQEKQGAAGGSSRGDSFENPVLEAEILDYGEDGTRIAAFHFDGIFMERLEEIGSMPLPPYIQRPSENEDRERYQTVYSRMDGSVAAPTAGLHFTKELLEKAREKGVETAFVTLHVGIGTFRPVKCEKVEDHHMHFEEYTISDEAAETINRAKREGRRVICVGTTSTRTIESAACRKGPASESGKPCWQLQPGSSSTGIFIYPGYEFKMTDALITNFHLPKSTLLMLISALYDREKILNVYEEAIREEYRFFSYGDAMFLV